MNTERPFILVAEDERSYAHVYEIKLEKEGFEVKVVSDGTQVKDAVLKRKPDLLLLDLMMPGKSGFDTLQELHDEGILKDLKVIVFSNLGQPEDIEKAKALGAISYYVKSNLSISDLVEKVRGALS